MNFAVVLWDRLVSLFCIPGNLVVHWLASNPDHGSAFTPFEMSPLGYGGVLTVIISGVTWVLLVGSLICLARE